MMGKGDNVSILICSLGQSWAVIPEVVAFLSPPKDDWLYANHPRRDEIIAMQQRYTLSPVSELWICTTDDPGVASQVEQIKRWLAISSYSIDLRVMTASEVADLDDRSSSENSQWRVGIEVKELIFRAVLHASARVRKNGGKLFLSLAGGRKTMSADMQQAGHFFGADALLHVIAPPYAKMSQAMKAAPPELFVQPLSPEDCHGLYPLVLGKTKTSPILTFLGNVTHSIAPSEFPLVIPKNNDIVRFRMPKEGPWLVDILEKRQFESESLLANFYNRVSENDRHENWRSLYRLPPAYIEYLRNTKVSETHRAWLRALPKADLHCHLGGCLSLVQQKTVAEVIVRSLAINEKSIPDFWLTLSDLACDDWPKDWAIRLRNEENRAQIAAWLLTRVPERKLQYELYERYKRFGLGKIDFALYELPGELTGSAQLCQKEALSAYVSEIVNYCQACGVRYLELRGSPQKYFSTVAEQVEFVQRLRTHFEPVSEWLWVRFIVSLDRRRPESWKQTVELVTTAHEATDGFVIGVDVAGDETVQNQSANAELARALEPVYRLCLPVTIHAGEGTSAENIWQAAYQLHADRIGHGLKLVENVELQARIRNRGICIEMCPTSNIEVVGFSAPEMNGIDNMHVSQPYPLKSYWEAGLPLAVCTDNPGISRTDMVEEFLQAASLSKNGLSLWDVLAMMKQGFVHAFLPANDKERLLKQLDQEVYDKVSSMLEGKVHL